MIRVSTVLPFNKINPKILVYNRLQKDQTSTNKQRRSKGQEGMEYLSKY